MENVESNLQATVSSSPYSSPQIKFTESLNSPIENENKIIIPARFWKWSYESNFEYREVFARGNFGEIKKAKFRSNSSAYSNEIVALKYPLYNQNYNWEKEYHNFSYELSCNLIPHPNIVNYISGLYLETPNRVGIVMEFIEKNLRDFIEKDNRSNEIGTQISIAKQISSGMNFLHSLNPPILHRDLRSPNILIKENLECKIGDFGISNNLGYTGMENKKIYTSLIPPETREKGEFTKKSDVYFFGWILFELFVGRKYKYEYALNHILQLLNEEEQKLNEIIKLKSPTPLSLELDEEISVYLKRKAIKHLIVKSIQSNPSNRLTFFELLLSLNNLLENKIDYSIISQMKEESLSSIMNKFNLTKYDLMNYTDSLGRKLVHEYCIYNNFSGLKELISIIEKECLNLVDKYNCTCAHFAARNGNIEILKFLLENGFNKWNEKENRFNLTPLALSIAMKHNECVHFLLSLADHRSINQSLISASQEGSLEYVKLFLEKEADINFVDSELGYTPLIWSSRNGHLEIVKFLVTNGALINQGTSDDNSTPLCIVSEKGHLEIAKFLINNGADIHHTTTDGFNSLQIGSFYGHVPIAQLLLEHGVNINQGRNTNGATALYLASEKNHLKLLQFLIKNGGNVNQGTNNMGYTPLYISCQNGHLEIVKELILNGANINQGTLDNGTAPLYIASANGHLEILKELVKSGANINQAKTNNGTAPLYIACENGHLEIVKELIKNGAKLTQSTNDGSTPLLIASQKGYLEIVKELINNGANLNQATTDDGETPLYVASQNGYLEIAKELINKGAALNQATIDDGSTPLYIACQNGHLEVVKELMNNGANINQATIDDGSTPLLIACENDYLEIVKELINNGVNLNQGTKMNGFTPLLISCHKGNFAIINELIKNGANLNQATIDEGTTPLHVASQKGNLELVKELINNGANIDSVQTLESESSFIGKAQIIGGTKYYFTSLYIAWWFDEDEVSSFLKDISDIELNIQLAKQNNHSDAIEFFESLII